MRKLCIFILSFVLIFVGCQPTPEVEPVIHKNEGTLEQQISATAAPAYEITIGAEEQKEPETPVSGSAEATIPEQNTLRTAVGAPETVQDSFDGPAADYDQLRENLQQNFDANAEGFRNADTKYDRPSQPWTGSFSDAIEGGISISNGERSFGMVAGNTVFSYAAGSHPSLHGWMDCPRRPRNEEEERWLQNAADFANSLGCAQVIPQYINDADEDTRVRCQVETGFNSGYKHFTLLPVYEGIPVYPYTTMYGSDTGRQAAGIPFARNLEQEEIFGTLYNGEVIRLQWNSPFTVTGVENENVPLLSFERIMEIFKRQVFMSVYCDQGHPITYKITAIQFSYMRVQIKDSDDYYLLPVWDFTGYMVYDWQMSPGDMAVARGFFHSMSILTINAVDGSVLDRFLGY